MTVRAFAGALAFVLISSQAPVVAQSMPSAAVARLEALTARAADLAAAARDSGAAGETLMNLAAERYQLLASLMDSAPEAVLKHAVAASDRNALPAGLRTLVEEHVEMAGDIEVTYEDARNSSRLTYVLDTGKERYSLHFPGRAPDWVTGQRVSVRGVRVNAMVAVDGTALTIGGSVASALPGTTGNQRTLVILVNFDDNRATPYTTADAARVVFSDTDSFLRENSKGATSLSGEVLGWFTIATSSTVCDTAAIATQAKAAAEGAGATLANYTRFVYAFPENACTFWGRGSVGGNPSQAWVNGDIALEVVGHELGHNLGLYHSRNMDCGATPIGSSCTIDEYGDTLDLMGTTRAHYNSFQKERLGWLASSQIVTVTSGMSGTFPLEPYAAPTTGVKTLKILKSTDSTTGLRTYYYVEARQAIGYDSSMSSWTNVLTGVAVHTGSESGGNTSYLLDMTPETGSWYDPALTGSRTFTDPDAGLTLTTISASASGAAVSVTLNPPASTCVAAAPGLTVTPSTTSAVAPGTAVSYTVAVTNNDPATCNSKIFSLAASIPSGWVASLVASSLALAPGATGSTTLSLASPATAPGGIYSFQVRGSDPTVTVHDTSASGTYSVASTTTAPPSAPRSMAASVSANTATLNWQPPSAGSMPSTYLLYVGTRSGASDVANGYNVGNVLSASGDLPKGTYYARVRAANSAGTSSNSNEVRFSIGRKLRTPSGFTVTWTGTTATLSWVAPAADSADDAPTSYVLEAGTTPGASNVARVNVGNRTSFRVEITSGRYYARVKAQNAFGESEPTEDIEIRTPGTPQEPTALAAGGLGATVDLRWTASAGGYAAAGYIVEAGSAPGLADLAVLTVGDVTRFTTTAPPGVYYVRVRAFNARGTSLPSNEVVVRR
jgi:hypothetical protein